MSYVPPRKTIVEQYNGSICNVSHKIMSINQNIQVFFSRYPSVQYKKGSLFIQPGDEIKYIYYVQKGYIRMFTVLPDGKELTANIFREGSYFPLFLVFAHAQNSYYFQPLTSAQFFKAPKEDVLQFIKSEPEILTEFTTRMSVGFHGLLESLQYQFFGSVHNKIAWTLTLLAKRFGKKTTKGIEIVIPLSHQDVANLTGIARETASVELKKLFRQKIISYTYKHITIQSMQNLVDIAQIDNTDQPLWNDL
jgi:CRP-like cAMP-binding protein